MKSLFGEMNEILKNVLAVQNTLNQIVGNNYNSIKNSIALTKSSVLTDTIKQIQYAMKSVEEESLKKLVKETSKILESLPTVDLVSAFEKIDFYKYQNANNSDSELSNECVKELYLSGEITDDDIATEINTIVNNEENVKKNNATEPEAKIRIAIKRIAIGILVYIFFTLPTNPIIEHINIYKKTTTR